MPSSTCCATTTICGEIRSPMFDLAEPRPSGLSCCARRRSEKGDEGTQDGFSDDSEYGNADASTPPRRLDVVRTFSPAPRVPCILAKLMILGWATSILCVSIDTHRYPWFWIAFLTHWALVVSVAYMITSVVSAIYLACHPPEDRGVLEGGLGLLLKTNWALFSIALPNGIMVFVLFICYTFYYYVLNDWAHESEVTSKYWLYENLMTHGGITLLIMIDGCVLSRIPIRMRQLILFELLSIFYFIFTIIHSYSGMGNPCAEEDDTRDDDAIYYSLRWKDNPAGTAITVALVVFVFTPAIGVFCRMISRMLPRRLCEDEGGQKFKGQQEMEQEDSQNDEEAAAAVVY